MHDQNGQQYEQLVVHGLDTFACWAMVAEQQRTLKNRAAVGVDEVICKKRNCSWRIIHTAQVHRAYIKKARLKIGAIGKGANGIAHLKLAHMATNL
uniref:Transposase MuDR plant domain-containing protein n=1 Tax=Romanomermis culicivorax TaxID=13658 RepID=A0A915L2V9_ROMCU